jgi:hypothetical protein
MPANKNPFSAGAPALGYNYQQRYALWWLLGAPEDAECQIECDDDIDLTDQGQQSLGSLKHKAVGDTLTDLSLDFWKSVRVWLEHFKKNPQPSNKVRFVLFTTSKISAISLLENFLPAANVSEGFPDNLIEKGARSKSDLILSVVSDLKALTVQEREDFFGRLKIFDSEPRIDELPKKIQNLHLRAVSPIYREVVYESLEGWWFDLTIKMMNGERTTPIIGMEAWEKIWGLAAQYREDNLPIDYEFADPNEEPDAENDSRNFVKQLRSIGISSDRIKRSIVDYYRATQQRSEWVRVDLKLDGELELYDKRLVGEWARQREIIWEAIEDTTPEKELRSLGKKLLNTLTTSDSERLRIRPRVTATFVLAGSYHILANKDEPLVHWHPHFRERVQEIFGGGGK